MMVTRVIKFELWGKDHTQAETAPDIPYLDIDGKDEPIDFLFVYNDKYGLIARANLQTFKGREKAGKSAAGIALIVAALKGEFLGIKASKQNLSLLWIDTEQDKNTLREKARAALEMAGLDNVPDRLKIVPLRAYIEPERLDITLRAIAENAPDLVFLDGVVDLCEEFNDEVKSRNVVNQLGKIAEERQCSIICLIHTNKKDDEARGHLGSVMQQKSAEIYQITKDGDIATITQPRSRFAPVPAISFEFTDNFKLLPVEAAAIRKGQELQTQFSQLFNGNNNFKYMDLVRAYMQVFGKSERAAKTAVKDAAESGILCKAGSGRNVLYTFLFPDIEPENFEDDDL